MTTFFLPTVTDDLEPSLHTPTGVRVEYVVQVRVDFDKAGHWFQAGQPQQSKPVAVRKMAHQLERRHVTAARLVRREISDTVTYEMTKKQLSRFGRMPTRNPQHPPS